MAAIWFRLQYVKFAESPCVCELVWCLWNYKQMLSLCWYADDDWCSHCGLWKIKFHYNADLAKLPGPCTFADKKKQDQWQKYNHVGYQQNGTKIHSRSSKSWKMFTVSAVTSHQHHCISNHRRLFCSTACPSQLQRQHQSLKLSALCEEIPSQRISNDSPLKGPFLWKAFPYLKLTIHVQFKASTQLKLLWWERW